MGIAGDKTEVAVVKDVFVHAAVNEEGIDFRMLVWSSCLIYRWTWNETRMDKCWDEKHKNDDWRSNRTSWERNTNSVSKT